jgi:cytochrome P450
MTSMTDTLTDPTGFDLSTLELFDGCDADDVDRVVGAQVVVRHLAEGEVLCREGDAASHWWIVLDGLADATSGGRYLATIGEGETVGELALLDGAPRAATVTAVTDLVVREIDGTQFLTALADTPRLTLTLLRRLATRLRRSNEAAPRAVVSALSAGVDTTAAPAPVGGAQFDPHAPGYFANPYAQYAAMRSAGPVHFVPESGTHIVTRYADVHRLTRDRSLMVSIEFAASTPSIDAERARLGKSGGKLGHSMLRKDGDDHARLRRLVSKVFTPKAITDWRTRADEIVDGLLATAAERDRLDVMDDYALLLPAQVISEMLGMPHGDIPSLRAWSNALTKTLDPLLTPDEEAAAIEASRAMVAYIEAIIVDKRAHPADDILSALILANDDGDSLDDRELLSQVVLLYVAGHETTLNLVGNGLTHLFQFRDQLDLLRTDPSLDANAIEELLRFDSPVQFTRRIAADELMVGDTTIAAGSVVLLGLGAANRDPDKWGPTADQVDLFREGANTHVSFGGGPHHCLGAALARLEAQIALPRLVRRFPRMEPAYDTPAWSTRMVLRGVEHLPVTLR